MFATALAADLRQALRSAVRQPWSTLAIAGTLAIGIGATTAIYAVFNFMFFRPLPGVPSERGLFTAQYKSRDQRASAYGSVAALPSLRAATAGTGVEVLGTADGGTAAIAVPGAQPTFEDGEFVTSQYFSTLGVRPRLGRLFTDDEADHSSEPMVIISERLWRLKLDSASNAVGKTLLLNGHPFIVAGVMDDFRGWNATRVGTRDWWAPLTSMTIVEGYGPSSTNFFYGRTRDGSSLPVIEQQLQTAYTSFGQQLSARDRAFVPFVSAGLQGYGAASTQQKGMRMYRLLMGAVALLLLLACANAATMLLARAADRERDTAVRLAIGADRSMVFRQFLVEAFSIAAVAGAFGVLTASALTRTFRGMRVLEYLPELDTIDLDARVLIFTFGIALATVVIFGLMPALIASRADVRGVLGRAGRGLTGTNRLRHGLVIGQIALSLVLVTGAAVLNRSLHNLLTADLGMDLRGVYKLALEPEDLGYSSAKARTIVRDAIGALRAAGFRDLASSSPEPLSGNRESIGVSIDGGPRKEYTAFANSVSAGYFDLFRMRVVAGRGFTDADVNEVNDTSTPVVLSVSMANDLFGTSAAVGRTFSMTRSVGMSATAALAQVVGVVEDTRSSSVRGDLRKALYHTRPSGWRHTLILIRPDGAVGPALDRIRDVVRSVDPGLPITTLRPLALDVADEVSQDRVLARLSGLVALLAALLAAAGVFSVVTQLVAERTRDFGIRAALGASGGDILRHVIHGVTRRSIAGAVIGLVLYWWVSGFLAARMYGLSALDPVTLGVTAAALIALAVAAAAIPARRAARINPAIALR